jgi:L-threonylcarbamoyladenylate synthase
MEEQERRSMRGEGASPLIFRLLQHGSSMRVVRSLVPILRDDGIVVVPTDTIYGFSARFDHIAPRKRILHIKGSDRDGSMVSLVSGLEMAYRYAEPPHGSCQDLLRRFWPGPLTAILRARPHVPTEFCGPGDTLAFRWPDSPFLQALLGALGVPLVSTSANRSGEHPITVFEDLVAAFGGEVEALVDGGEHAGAASTIVELTGQEPVLIRRGSLDIGLR